MVFTLTAGVGSIHQDLKILATGQTLSVTADIARDNQWGAELCFGFYDANTWDVFAGCFINVIPLVTPDTDGTLDTFYKVVVNNVTLPTNNYPVFLFLGNSADTYASATVGAQCAIDNVQAIVIPSSVEEWDLY